MKQWFAKVGSERIDESINPELSMQRAIETYKRKGYPEEWISQRMKTIKIRNELTSRYLLLIYVVQAMCRISNFCVFERVFEFWQKKLYKKTALI